MADNFFCRIITAIQKIKHNTSNKVMIKLGNSKKTEDITSCKCSGKIRYKLAWLLLPPKNICLLNT